MCGRRVKFLVLRKEFDLKIGVLKIKSMQLVKQKELYDFSLNSQAMKEQLKLFKNAVIELMG